MFSPRRFLPTLLWSVCIVFLLMVSCFSPKILVAESAEGSGATADNGPWWSFRPLIRPLIPQVKSTDSIRSGIDHFVISRLEDHHLSLSPEADRATLVRRVTWDLLGILPTTDQMQEFLNDSTPDAYERLVDRLLASTAYGERWGRHWLDVARYADTKDGVLMYGENRIRPYAYTYRDYVIRAWNEDLPFDRFVHEQLAADQIQPAVEPWRLAGMGLLTLGRMFDNNIHDVIDDRIDVVTRGFLGLTVSCARCHDHKYDPITMADYYGLYGVFASCEVPLELPLTQSGALAADVQVFEQELGNRRKSVEEFLDSQHTLLLETARNRVTDYLKKAALTPTDPLETAIYFLSLAPEDLRPPIVARWRRHIESRARDDDRVFGPWVRFMAKSDAELAQPGVVEGILAACSSSPSAPCDPLPFNSLVIKALREQAPRSRSELVNCYGELLRTTWETWKKEREAAGKTAPSDSDLTGDPQRDELLTLLVSRDSPGWFPRSQTRRYMSRMETDSYGGKVNELDVIAVKSAVAAPRAMVLVDSPELHDPRIFQRGNPSRPGEAVPRRFIGVISNENSVPFQHGSGRLDLALSITNPSNPLTARVIANRVWMHHFGEPLVSNPSDFGTRTSSPPQLPLLDYLASQLIAHDWSLKALHREIVLSATYRQSSFDRPECRSVDPENTLIWRMNRRRMDLESMRDSLLAVSGRMAIQLGGRPVDVVGNPAESRRTVYGLVDRQNVPSLFRSFDFASPDASAERRSQTTVPQQALFGLNSPFVFVVCRDLVKSLEPLPTENGPSVAAVESQRISQLFQKVYSREPTEDERVASLELIHQPVQPDPEVPLENRLTAWERLAQTLLLSNEFLFVD